MVEIVPMRSDDVVEARVLWARTEGIALHEADSPEALRGYLERNPGCSFVARDGSQLAGVALAGHDGRRGYLHHVAVAPAFRKQGIGRDLVERCLSALRDQGILKCHLFVLNDNVEGMKFWASLGWRQRDLQMMSLTLSKSETA